MQPPKFPAAPYAPEHPITPARRGELIDELSRAPRVFRDAVRALTPAQLDTPYVNWTLRQIVHHTADSHTNCAVRFKWALTEPHPTIKAYDETAWAELPDARADVRLALDLLSAVHAKLDALLRSMDDTDFARTFHHPESGEDLRLDEVLPLYCWHTRHHAGQIRWVREQRGW